MKGQLTATKKPLPKGEAFATTLLEALTSRHVFRDALHEDG